MMIALVVAAVAAALWAAFFQALWAARPALCPPLLRALHPVVGLWALEKLCWAAAVLALALILSTGRG